MISKATAWELKGAKEACRVYIEIANALVEDFRLPTCIVLEVLNSSVISILQKNYNIALMKIVVVL